MIVSLLFAGLVLFVAGVWVTRRLRARAARARMHTGPGSSLVGAIAVRSFDAIDREVAARLCACGARLTPSGEGTRQVGERRYRATRLVCGACEEEAILYFDVTDVLH